LSGLLLNVARYAPLRFKILLAANLVAIAPGPLMVTMGLPSLVFAALILCRRGEQASHRELSAPYGSLHPAAAYFRGQGSAIEKETRIVRRIYSHRL
jgi:hypothetical protein